MKRKNVHVKPYLLTKKLLPENQETPIHFLAGNITPLSYFYKRNHFSYPKLMTSFFHLQVEGNVKVPRTFSYNEILSLPTKTVKVMLECAGDKRSSFQPKTFGEQWGEGALSQGYWKGVPLRTLFQYTGIRGSAKEIVFEGHDTGMRTDITGIFAYERSLPIDKALHPDTLVAYELNGEPLSFKHGYPLRLIVPQWYAMASVKWLKKISVIDGSFQGPFQAVDYIYYPEKNRDAGKYPVTTMNINSTIQQPLDLAILDKGVHTIQGIAWTGEGEITKVEISTNDGETWMPAVLQPKTDSPYTWVNWTFFWNANAKGECTILSRATDSMGRIQPEEALWNRKGYGYHAICRVKVKVE
ncbi:sulfite oxidase [Ectobacillus panaciterrae]|uniref:sulfite oxidase n=1 Tax=Ectobacillus panaciterrae TaxID=363872 RepID=UPI00040119C8|nr:sulfite oxidase [Ectobacillus panaciterrae]